MPIWPWRRRRTDDEPMRHDAWLREARILELRCRREARAPFSGRYASAFRGGGLLFEESRPYVPGDDVRRMDWNAMARTGQPFVKHYREERNRTLELVLDASASMAFRPGADNPAHVAAHVAALLAAAAGRVGDRVGIVTCDETARRAVRPQRVPLHRGPIVETLAEAAARASGCAGLDDALAVLQRDVVSGSIVVVISDFRSPAVRFADPIEAPRRLAGLAARNELVCVVIEDPRVTSLPDVGRIRIGDPERPGVRRLVDSGDPAFRTRYAVESLARRRELGRVLRRAGSDVVFVRTDRDPLNALARFFERRAARSAVTLP